MEVNLHYNQTEIGVFPVEWTVSKIKDASVKITDGEHATPKRTNSGYYLLSARNILNGGLALEDVDYVGKNEYERIRQRCNPETGDVLISCSGTIGRVAVVPFGLKCVMVRSAALIKHNRKKVNGLFVQYFLQSNNGQSQILRSLNQGAQANLFINHIENLKIPLPTLTEQTAIATALSDADALISSLEKLIAKKRNIKQGAMQQLLQPKEGWEVKRLGEVADCLDYLRVPLNDDQRSSMKGDIPYCGANGIVDYVNDFVVNDDIILMAEDGGYFDQYKTRPIAYRMRGKCWVNNHAHILKAKKDYDQGFLFFLLVHKNIMDYINGGTRAKLNKGELLNIQLSLPKDKAKQIAASAILNDMDFEITTLESKLDKSKQIKQGMMQQLLTGKIRLV